MPEDEYYITQKNSGRAVIRQQDSDLAIDIYQLEKEGFFYRRDKLQLFGDDHSGLIAFQTGLVAFAFETDLIANALEWYAGFIDYPQMVVRSVDPRPAALNE